MGRKDRPRRKDYFTGPLVVVLLGVALAILIVVAVTSKGTH